MGIIINKDKAYNFDIPCHGYRYDGKFLLWKQGVIGTLTDEQETALCDKAIALIEPLPERMQERMAIFRALERKPICMNRSDKEEALKVLMDVLPTVEKDKHERLLRAYLFIEDLPVCQ